MDETKINEALEGKLELSELNDEELTEFRTKASDLAEQAKGEVTGLREAKRAETERVEKLKKEAEELEKARGKTEEEKKKAEEELNKGKEDISQFRTEQIEKAKEKFFAQFPDAKEKEEEISQKFERLDSGKIDSDFILKDFVSAYAATDPDGYLSAREKANQLAKNAEEFNKKGAGGNPSSSGEGGEGGKQYSESTKNLAKDAGISEESADKIEKEGMKRTLD